MVEFAALEVKVVAIRWQRGRDTPSLDDGGGGGAGGGGSSSDARREWQGAERGISASFHPLCRERRDWRHGGCSEGPRGSGGAHRKTEGRMENEAR